jgi:excisionase family DNA binding protein
MKFELETEDIVKITQAVLESLKPYLLHKQDGQEEIIFDVPGLCEYLHVTSKWIHERTHLKQIPYYKISNKQLRFRKKDINKWLESLKTPIINEYRGRSPLSR